MVIKLSPPTQNEIDLYEGTKTDQLFPTDLNQEVDKDDLIIEGDYQEITNEKA